MNRIFALCAGLGLFLTAVSPAAAQTHFTACGIADGNINNATIVVPTTSTPDVNGAALASGGEIAVFKAGTDQCAGAQVWNGTNTTVTVWGDDDRTAAVEGLVPGDSMVFRVWDSVSGIEFMSERVEFTYDPNSGLNSSGRYANDGLYVLADISVVDDSLLPPDPPQPAAPADADSDVSVNADLSWSSVAFANTYDVQVDTNSDFSSPEYSVTAVADTTVTTTGLSNGTLYHWRVRAVGTGGTGDWSGVRTFTTALQPAPDTPVLDAPDDGAGNIPLSAVLDWSGVDGADTYRVQLANTVSFDNPVLDAADLDTTSILADGLDHFTEYFWRVRAVGSGGPGDWSVVRSFVTEQVPAPVAPTLTAPLDAAVDMPLEVDLTWQAVDYATSYDVQLDDDPSFASPDFDASGLDATTAGASGLENATTYHWRVRAAGPGGTGPWSESRSFTTVPQDAPDAPVLIAPAHEAGDMALNVALSWSSVSGAATYHVQLDDNADFSSPRADASGLPSTTYAVANLGFATTYHWRVRAAGEGGDGAWSAARSFTTVLPPPPGAPEPLLPADGATGVSVSASIDWSTVDGADTYDLQVDTNDGFTTPFRDYQELETTAKIATGLEPVTEYFWRVRARGPGGAGAWSAVRSFMTEQIAEMDAPVLVSPDSEQAGMPKQAVLTWAVVGEAQLYHVQVDDDAAFVSPEFENNTLSVTSATTTPLSASTHYYWRVRGSGSGGNGPWSEARRFLTQPDPPQLLTPTPDSVGVSTNAVFTWAESPGADRYYFQLDDDPEFGSPRIDINAPDMLTAQAAGLESSTVYYWRVRASKNTGKGPWSPVRSFTTGLVQAPARPVATTPTDGAVDVSTTVVLEWTRPSGAVSYRWQLDDDPAFGSPIISVQNHSGNTAAVPGLAYLKTYYWRVQAVNAGGASFWSETASFTTIQITAPAAPSITAPYYGQQEVDVRPTLIWSASARSAAYEVQVDDAFNFSSPEFHADNVASTAVNASGLRPETFYYWRVRGLNAGGSSPWSAVGFFTTEYVPIPSSPALVYPSNDAVGFTASVLLDWSPVEEAYGYHLQVDDDPQFGSPVMDDDQVLTESVEVTGLSANTTYRWRVRATNPAGFSVWSDTRTFRTAPGAPEMVAPLDGSMDVRVDQLLAWAASDGASAYRLQIASESSFTEPIVDIEGVNRSFAFGEVVLDDETEYWWRVRAVSETGQSDWSEPFSFTTGPFLTVGVDGDGVVPGHVRLDPAFPNPFSTSTTFRLHLPAPSRVVMKVFDMLGREVAHLVDDELAPGAHDIGWRPDRLSSGVYVAFLRVDGKPLSRMVTLTR